MTGALLLASAAAKSSKPPRALNFLLAGTEEDCDFSSIEKATAFNTANAKCMADHGMESDDAFAACTTGSMRFNCDAQETKCGQYMYCTYNAFCNAYNDRTNPMKCLEWQRLQLAKTTLNCKRMTCTRNSMAAAICIFLFLVFLFVYGVCYFRQKKGERRFCFCFKNKQAGQQ